MGEDFPMGRGVRGRQRNEGGGEGEGEGGRQSDVTGSEGRRPEG